MDSQQQEINRKLIDRLEHMQLTWTRELGRMEERWARLDAESRKRDAELATMFRELAGLVSNLAERVNGRRP